MSGKIKNKKLTIFLLLGLFCGIGIFSGNLIYADAAVAFGHLGIPKSTQNTSDGESSSNDSSANISETSSRYNAGQYKVGTDIPAGEYVVFASSSSATGYFCVSYDSNDDNIIFNDNFAYNTIITVEDGEYLTLNRCYAIPIDNNPEVNTSGTGMFKVGLHIPAGEYKLDSGNEKGYYCVYSSSRQQSIVSNNNFEGQNYVTVSDGQYLELKRCHFTDTPDTPTEPETTYSDAETVKKVQEALNNAGYDCGTVDGVAGSKTQSAIQQYQEDYRLTISGTINDELLESLESNEATKEVESTTTVNDNAETVAENGPVAQSYEKDFLGNEFDEVTADFLETDTMLSKEIALRLYCIGKSKECVENYIDFGTAKMDSDDLGVSYEFDDIDLSVYYDGIIGDENTERWYFDNDNVLQNIVISFDYPCDPNFIEFARELEETLGSYEEARDSETGIAHYYWNILQSTQIIEYYNFIGSDSSKDDGIMELTIEYCEKE